MKRFFILILMLYSCSMIAQNRSDSIHIAHYTLNLNLLDLSHHTIDGNVELKVVYKMNNIPSICLDLQQYTVDSIKIDGEMVTFNYADDLLQIPVSNVNISDTQDVAIFYHGTPSQDPRWGGFYFSGNYAFNMGVGMTVEPHSYGRAWYPCIDEFTDKSTYTYNIRTQNSNKAICGGELVDSVLLPDNTILWTWQLRQPIPTYLSSIAVSDYHCYSDTIHGLERVIPINIYATDYYIDDVPGSFQNLKAIIRNYEKLFLPYPWQRIGYVVVPFNGGAMEHATNISYPAFAVNGNLDYQSLIFHEFSHAWFGNLLTCANASDMWINEGFASYCELIANQILDTSMNQFNANLIALHRKVLKSTHVDDGGYFALDQVPSSVTYGSTSYDKGSLVVHTLRNYLGDSLFFSSIHTLLENNAFGNLNSNEWFQQMSQISGINLMPFYEGWVHQPGFLHFSVDSVMLINATTHTYRVFLRQRLHQATHFSDDNRIDVLFISDDGDTFLIPSLSFSGETGFADVNLPFFPALSIVDPNRKLGDAIIDYDLFFAEPGIYNCSDANCRIRIDELSSPTNLRVEHNLVAPDPLKNPNENIDNISESHYWRIESYSQSLLSGNFQFKYNAVNSSTIDYNLLHGFAKEQFLLLYRRNPKDDWQIMPTTLSGNDYSGTLIAKYLMPGEYTLAVGNFVEAVKEQNLHKLQLSVYPNPAINTIYCSINKEVDSKILVQLIDTNGRIISVFDLTQNPQPIDISHLAKGRYILSLKNGKKDETSVQFVKY